LLLIFILIFYDIRPTGYVIKIPMRGGKYTVFLVDDSVDDRLFMRMALERSSKLVLIREASDGQEALDYLRGNDLFNDRQLYPLPDILLLDLKMPKKNGFDVLKELKELHFKTMVAAIISGSNLKEDVTKSLALGADAYFTKTAERIEQEAMVKSIEALVEKKQSSP